jgi:hypothetical protein
VQRPPGPPQAQLALAARYGSNLPQITAGLHWRIYPVKPDPGGAFRPIKEDRGAAPVFSLPPGNYVVHVGFGLASVTRTVALRADGGREDFDIPAGGLRLNGRVGDARVPPGQVWFDLFPGSQFEAGDRRAIVQSVAANDVILVPEGNYHIVSHYGDGNSVVRSDIRVQTGKLIDAVVTHRAASYPWGLDSTRSKVTHQSEVCDNHRQRKSALRPRCPASVVTGGRSDATLDGGIFRSKGLTSFSQ